MALMYKIEFPDGKLYIGVTKFALHRRVRNHASTARNGDNRPVSQAIRRFGLESCKASVLCFDDKPALVELERPMIERLGCAFPAGYNAYVGSTPTSACSRKGSSNGVFVRKHSESTKALIAAKRKERNK